MVLEDKDKRMNLTDLSIIVPTRNEARNIARLVDSIPADVTLILVDAGEDETGEIACKMRPGRTLVHKSPERISAARHIGAQLAHTPWLLFSDADIHFSEDYFKVIQALPVLDACYGPKLSKDEFVSYYRQIAKWQSVADACRIPAVSGSNFIIRRDVYFSCGGFDPVLLVNEDSELGWRLSRQGFKIKYMPNLAVYAHDHRRLYQGSIYKTIHSVLRCSLLYLNLMPRRWRSSDWGYWNHSFPQNRVGHQHKQQEDMMRIAFISETFLPKIDGITNTLCRLLEHLDQRGHPSVMFAPQGAPSIYAGTPILQPVSIPFPFYPELKIANPFTSLERHLVEFRPDLIHVVNPFSIGVAGTRYARMHDIPLVASYHTDVPGYTTRFYGMPFMTDLIWDYFRWVHNQADLTLCPSHATLQELNQKGFKNLKIWSRGVDMERFAPSKCRPEWRWGMSGGRPESMILLYVGRLAAEKRVEWLLPVIQSLPFAHLVIVGDGPRREELEALFGGTNTTFTGYLQGEDLARAYASADIFVFPSANETFGNVVLEAMASGLPVVAPRSGGVMDSVIDGETGLLFDSDQQNDLVAAVSKIIMDPGMMRKMGSAARRTASKRSWNGILDHLIEDYLQTINQHHHQKVRSVKPVRAAYQKLPFWLE